MTIRDLLSINAAWFNDYIEISERREIILREMPILKMHPIWLDYEIKNYYLLPYEKDETISAVNCVYNIRITGTIIFQDKTTEIDVALNERIKENESTNND